MRPPPVKTFIRVIQENGRVGTAPPVVPRSEGPQVPNLIQRIPRQPFDKLALMSSGIIGAHVLLYSNNPEADRAFFRDVLGFRAVDAGGGWLIFALPPAEVGIHPSEGERRQLHGGRQLLSSVLYLICDDLTALMKSLQTKGVSCSQVEEEDWGIKTTIHLPSGGEIGLYQPTHPTALGLR
jgi:catechol 2,3-dioxygenase-like lactoylglutathione lyase family enzyme